MMLLTTRRGGKCQTLLPNWLPDQIRTIIRTFRDRFFTDLFPGRTEIPKTLIFAKDDSHADDIVQIIREEFGKGNDFAQKITYRTGAAKVLVKKTDKDGNEYEVEEWKSTGLKPEDLLTQFRTAYNPRIDVDAIVCRPMLLLK